MALIAYYTFSKVLNNHPLGPITGGPITEGSIGEYIYVTGVMHLTTEMQQLIVPDGGKVLLLSQMAQTENVIIAASQADSGINLGSSWNYQKLGVLSGTTTLWFKCDTGTMDLYYEFN